MKWSDIQIIDREGNSHTGIEAQKFVANRCKSAAIVTEEDGVIKVNENLSADDKAVRAVLFATLAGKAKSLKILTRNADRSALPLVRGDMNPVNVVTAKLKVKFIFKQDPRDESEAKIFDDSRVTVRALLQGADAPLTKDAERGVAGFKKVSPGQYTITPEYSVRDECRFDYDVGPKEIYLSPGEEGLVVFEVEPLYQKVQLIAHCLLAVPDFTYVLSDNDRKRVKIDEKFDWNKLEYQPNPEKDRRYKSADCSSFKQASFSDSDQEKGFGTMTMNEKDQTKYYDLADLPEFDPGKVEIKGLKAGTPNVYVVELKEKHPGKPIYPLSLSKNNDDRYYTPEDLKEYLDDDLIEKIAPVGEENFRQKYDVTFRGSFKPSDLKKKLPRSIGEFGEKETYRQKDFKDVLSPDKGVFNSKDEKVNSYTAYTLKLKIKEDDVFWRLPELDEYLKDEAIEKIEPDEENPHFHTVKFKQGLSPLNLVTALPADIGVFEPKYVYTDILTLQVKKAAPDYWTLDDLQRECPELESMINITGLESGPGGVVQKHKHTFAFKGAANKALLDKLLKDKKLLNSKVKIQSPMGKGSWVLAMQVKPPTAVYYTLEDLEKTVYEKIETIGEPAKAADGPDVYRIRYKTERGKYALNDLEGKWMGRYHGLYSDLDDMNARIGLVEATLKVAYKRAAKDPTILKVFMIPECYFQGRYGSYLLDSEEGSVSHLFTRLLNLVGEAKWRDWVFVFGTVNFTFGEAVREMMNYSPVIRGGLGPAGQAGGGGEKDPQLRLIQKLTNSAELLDQSQLLHHLKEAGESDGDSKKDGENEENPKEDGESDEDSKDEKYYEVRKNGEVVVRQVTGVKKKDYHESRTPSVNDAVQFQASQNEEEVAKLLRRLLDVDEDFKDLESMTYTNRHFGEIHRLEPIQWRQLKDELEKNVKQLGFTRVVRSIRKCQVAGLPGYLSKWGHFSGYKDKTEAQREPETCIEVTREKLLVKLIRDAYERFFARHPLGQDSLGNNRSPQSINIGWKVELMLGRRMTAEQMRAEILRDVERNFAALVEPFGIALPYQRELLLGKLRELIGNDRAAIEFVVGRTLATSETAQLVDDQILIVQVETISPDVYKKSLEPYVKPTVKPAEVVIGKGKIKNYVPVKIAGVKDKIQELLKGDEKQAAEGTTAKVSIEFVVTGNEALKQQIREALGDEMKHVPIVAAQKEDDVPVNFSASIYPMWKKLLELYLVELMRDNAVLSGGAEKMDYRDYCFAAARKAGPWLTLEQAERLEPCKRLLFGLEICADHANGRLKNLIQQEIPAFEEPVFKSRETIAEDAALTREQITSNREKLEKEKIEHQNLVAEKRKLYEKEVSEILQRERNKPIVPIDIQLVPSAGMFPTDAYIVARKGGYCFNCDGWNKGKDFGVNLIKVMFDGPTGAPAHDAMHPVTPHTAIAKGGYKVKRDILIFKPERIKLSAEPETKDLGKDILSRAGIGELHVYNPLNLPKNAALTGKEFVPTRDDRLPVQTQSRPNENAGPNDEQPGGPGQDRMKTI